MVIFFAEPVKQEPWYLQIRSNIVKSNRPIDKMTIAELYKMYREEKFLCDDCGNPLKLGWQPTLEEHIIHIINPLTGWACGDCMDQMRKEGRILA